MHLYRTKLKVIVLGVILTGVVLLIYQMICLDFPRDELLDYSGYSKIVESGKQTLLRGIRRTDTWKYRPNERGNFMCFNTREELDFSRVNDDFCDCVFDGSDEPGTSACQNGRFYCDTQNSGFPGNLYYMHVWVYQCIKYVLCLIYDLCLIYKVCGFRICSVKPRQ